MESRIRSAMTLYAFAILGLFLMVAPWTPVWIQATVTLLPRSVGSWLLTGWARGIVSGLGVLDVLVALHLGVELWRDLREVQPRSALLGRPLDKKRGDS